MRTAGNDRAARLWSLSGVLLVTAILLMVNYVASRRYARLDWTREGLFTLSERTEQVLADLERDVEIYLFIGSGDPLYQDVKELLDRYKALSPRLSVQYVDPDLQPARFRALAEKFGLRAAQLETGETVAEVAAIVTAGDKRWSINRHDMVSVNDDAFGMDPSEAKVDVKTEQALTGALVQVTTGRPTRICATRGHGEWSVDAPERSLYAAQTELKRENIEFSSIELRGQESIDEGCDAVWVVGPLKPLSEAEVGLLRRYVEGGGNLMLALDPILEGGELLRTGLEPLLSDWGVKPHTDVVIELDRALLLSPNPAEHFLVANWGDHPTVRPLKALGAPVVMHMARSFGVADGDAEVLLRTSEKSYGETDLDALAAGDALEPTPEDIQGPLAVAAAVDTQPGKGDDAKPGGRVLVLGDSEWLNMAFLQSPEVANIDMLASLTGWLTEREALVSIAPRQIDALPILITEDALTGILVRVVVLMPLAALVLGLGIWWQRRA